MSAGCWLHKSTPRHRSPSGIQARELLTARLQPPPAANVDLTDADTKHLTEMHQRRVAEIITKQCHAVLKQTMGHKASLPSQRGALWLSTHSPTSLPHP